MNKNYIRLLGIGHLVTDIYQGALPAILPFLISNKNIGYAAAAFLIFAANASSSIIQPLFGIYSDKISAPWALPLGLLLGGLGIGLAGIMPSYYGIFILVGLSGIGIALYHPEGARLTNKYAGKNKTSAVSIFAAGGNIGFAVGPIITTAVLMLFGLKGTVLLSIPAIIMSIILITQIGNFSKTAEKETSNNSNIKTAEVKQIDEWKPFIRLLLTLLCRSIVFFGFNTFLTLYWMKDLHQTELAGSIALSTLIVVGAIGTLFAGKLADKIGNKKIIITGYSCLFPLLLLFLNIKNPIILTVILIPMGLSLYAPYSPMVALGQKYLPNHVGLASGVTMGLAVTMGGIVSPLLGLVSDHYGIHAALSCLVIMPIIAVILASKLPRPNIDIKEKEVLREAASY
jgi:FSR family fosmidomycin resistance protein-like MFS transporter